MKSEAGNRVAGPRRRAPCQWMTVSQVVCLGWRPKRPIRGSSWDRSARGFFDQSEKKAQSWLKGNKRDMSVNLNLEGKNSTALKEAICTDATE